jgi:uncharacterized protein (TIGR02271 family)
MAATSEQRSTVVGVFEDRQQADSAISELRQAGFREDQIAIAEDRSVGGSESDRTTVTITADGRYDEATALLRRHGAYDLRTTAHASRTAEGVERIQLHEEELQAQKQPVETGAARIRKEVVTEYRTMEIPVQREEVVIERHAPTGEPGASDLRPGEEIRVPVRKEQVTVEKRPVVKEEVTVGKRVVEGTERVGGEVRREEVRVEREGDVDIRGGEPDQK